MCQWNRNITFLPKYAMDANAGNRGCGLVVGCCAMMRFLENALDLYLSYGGTHGSDDHVV